MRKLVRPRRRGRGLLRRCILFRSGLVIVGFCLLAAAAPAENLTGTWMGLIPGVERDIEFKIVQHGATLSGKLYRDGASSPIIDGKVDERGEVEFVVETREQAGNQVNIVVYRFEGVVCEGGIDLTRELSAARDAGAEVERHARTRPSAPLQELYARASVLRTDRRLAVRDQEAESWKRADPLWAAARMTAAW